MAIVKTRDGYADQRVGIFIDVQNLYHSAKNIYGGRVNYKELIRTLLDGRRLIRSMAYVVKSEGIVEPARGEESRQDDEGRSRRSPASESAFFEALQQAGLELRMKDLQVYPGGFKKADWDVGMAVDAIRTSGSMDAVILVTGDGDFVPLIEYLKWGLGKFVEVAAFRRSASSRIQEAADKFINIEEIPRAIMKGRAIHAR